jgi:hypothetical protein
VTVDHHIARDLLGAYVDDELEAPTRAQLEAHLAACQACRSLLDGSPPVPLARISTDAPTWDERGLRRAVRRTLLSSVVASAGIALLVLLLAGLLLDPLLRPIVTRGDRLEQAVQATFDIPTLFTPGASIGAYDHQPAGRRARIAVQVGRPVGAHVRPLAEYAVVLSAGAMRAEGTREPPFLNLDDVPVRAHPTWNRAHIVAGTVATVQLEWTDPIDRTEAEALVGPDTDARLIWVAFAVDPLRGDAALPDGWDPTVDLGYATCGGFPPGELEPLGMGGSGTPNVFPTVECGLDNALDQVRRATANLAAADELWDTFPQHDTIMARIDDAAAWLADHQPDITSVVITGPSEILDGIVTNAGADTARLLGIDFYNWPDDNPEG